MNRPTGDNFSGCMLGLALGDALGAPHEGGPLERLIWSLIGRTATGRMRWTDDTQMSLDLAQSLLVHGELDQDDLAGRLAGGYRWSRGYGPGAAKLLKRIRRGESWREANRSVFKDGSFGNGAVLRAPVLGLFHWWEPDTLVHRTRASAEVTHAHPLAIEGAVLIATATAAAVAGRPPGEVFELAAGNCSQPPIVAKLELARQWLGTDRAPREVAKWGGVERGPDEVAQGIGNGIAAADSCVTALYLALRFWDRDFGQLCRFVASCGGDTDSIGAMAGAIWGAAKGRTSLPEGELKRLEDAERIEQVAQSLYAAAHGRMTPS